MSIRPMQPSDIPLLATVYVDLYARLNIGEEWNSERAQLLLKYWFEHFPELCFTAEADGKPVGAVVVGIKPWWDGNHLFDGEIFVHPDFEGSGIGKALLKKAFEVAKEKHNAVRCDFFTFTGTHSPMAWYEKMGFKQPNGYCMVTGNVEEILKNLS